MTHKQLVRSLSLLAIFAISAAAVSAQITINIPGIPKIKKTKPQPTSEPSRQSEPSPSTGSDDEPTAPAAKNECNSGFVQVHLEDIEKTKAEAEEFRPGLRDYFVSTLSDRKNLYLESALSPYMRKEWITNAKMDPETVNCLAPALDGLAAAARKTIAGYTGPAGYTLGTPAEKKVLLSGITDIGQAQVFKVGIKQANWLIDKDSYNLPTARYKHGVIWAKYSNYDDGLCRIFWVNIVQDYAGGGTYGASYGNFISRAIAGCPAGK
jgi:hypothetical protein